MYATKKGVRLVLTAAQPTRRLISLILPADEPGGAARRARG
jgi:hypothetical protein